MAKGPQGNVRPHAPSQADREQAIAGEVVEATERALQRSSVENDLDASLAVALSEAEINQQIATARRFPRQKQKAVDDIMALSCQDTPTAMECNYSLPRGRDPETGKPKAITGPSIRFAELVAQCWGNNRVASRVIAVDRKDKFIEAEGIYHDLETNYAVAARVRRRISDKQGRLFSEDMIIVTGNAAASIALRNAILRGAPKPVWRKAYEEVMRAIAGDTKTLGARRVELLTRFRDELGIKPTTLYQILGISGEADVGLQELVVAAGFFTALRNNETTAEELLREAAGPQGVGDRQLGGAFEPQGRPPAADGDKVDPNTGEVTEKAQAGSQEGQAAPPATETATDEAKPRIAPRGEADKQPDQPAKETEPADPPQRTAADIAAEARAKDAEAAAIAKASESGGAGEDDDAGGDRLQEGCASPSEIYMLAGDSWGPNGKRATYQDGVRFSSAGRKGIDDGSMFIYGEHAPEAAEDGGEGESSSTPQASSDVSSSPALEPAMGEAIDKFREDCRNATSWLQVKQAVRTLSAAPGYEGLPAEIRNAELAFAYVATSALADKGDPVRVDNEPTFYALWLSTEPTPEEVDNAWRRLVRSEAYRKLKSEQQDDLAERTLTAKGDVG